MGHMGRGRGLHDPATVALVDRQMRHWELARRQRQRATVAPPEHPGVEDFICVSRMAGVGDDTASLLGRRLGWPVFDKEILAAMAGDDRRTQQIYESLDERDVGWWEELLHPLIREGMARNDYFHNLCRTALTLARQSPGVFVGRGLDQVLPASQGLRVQLVAPVEARVAWYARHHGVEREEARGEIERIEAERSAFLRQHFRLEAVDPLRYDLTLRMDRLPPEHAVELILTARRGLRQAA